jgi:hypothetical protein
MNCPTAHSLLRLTLPVLVLVLVWVRLLVLVLANTFFILCKCVHLGLIFVSDGVRVGQLVGQRNLLADFCRLTLNTLCPIWGYINELAT